jgi:hypothetical protein
VGKPSYGEATVLKLKSKPQEEDVEFVEGVDVPASSKEAKENVFESRGRCCAKMGGMGCDIHPHIEYKYPSDTEYEWFASPHIAGDYTLFTLLAGVRAGWVERHHGLRVEALFAPRGLPEHTSSTTSRGDDGFEWWSSSTGTWDFNSEYHSHSWLGTEELRLVFEAYLRTLGYSFETYRSQCDIEWGVELNATIRAMEALPNARLVFWFDN